MTGELPWPQLIPKRPYSARFLFQTSLPDMSRATICPVPNQAYTRWPSVTGLDVARLCFSWTSGRGPSDGTSYSHRFFPLALSNAETRKVVVGVPVAMAPEAAPPRARSPAAAASSPCTRRGPERATPVPSCDVTNTLFPHTIGDDMPIPRIEAFHAMFSVSLQRTGRLASGETPVDAGPRQFGQFSADSGTMDPTTSTANRLNLRMRKPPSVVAECIRPVA